MALNTVTVQELTRQPQEGPADRLVLEAGVNVIVGPPNTGKTKWLQLLDYLFGNDATPEDALGDEVSLKYDSAKAVLLLAGERVSVERRWKELGGKGKIY